MNALVFIQERAVSNFAEVSADFGVKLKKALQVKLSQKVWSMLLVRKWQSVWKLGS